MERPKRNSDTHRDAIEALLLHAAETGGVTGFAGCIRARIIAEGAKAPTTPDADEILKENGVFVIPNILCNAGRGGQRGISVTATQTRIERTLHENS